jgi:8-oxo-dGTP diphosphatase
MPIPAYVLQLREHIGHATLLLPAVGAIIWDEAGRVLLIRRGDGRGWSLPGGIMEPGESVVEAVIREVREETGLQVEPVKLIGVYSDPEYMHITFSNGDQAHLISSTFECRVLGGELAPDGDESLEVVFVAPDSLPDRVVCDHAVRIEDALAGRDTAVFR